MMDTNKPYNMESADKILLVAAMPKEAQELLPLFSEPPKKEVSPLGFESWQGTTHKGQPLLLATSGIGKVSAAVATAEAIRLFSPTLILNVGVSGTLSASVERGDIVVANWVCYHDVYCGAEIPYGQVQGYPLRYPTATPLIEKFKGSEVAFLLGGVACGDRFLSSPSEFSFIKSNFPDALALDMESAAVAQTAYIHHLPLMVIRLISDTPDRADGYAQYCQFWKEKAFRTERFAAVHQLINAI